MTVNEAWLILKENIINAANEAIGKRKVKRTNAKSAKPWFTPEVKTLAAKKKQADLQLRQKSLSYDEYKNVRSTVNNEISAIKRAYWEQFSADMEYDLYGAQKKVWGMLRNRKKPINEYLSFSKIPISKWTFQFQHLYSNTEQQKITDPEISNNGIEEYSIALYEVEMAITKIKNRKSPGPDNIHNEMIKYGGASLAVEITHLFNKILETKMIPDEWRESTTIPIYKKGDKQDPNNYRGITLLNTILKLLTKIIANEINKTGFNDEQQGFRQNRSTIDAVFIIRQVAEKAIEYNKPLYMCFIDLTKAFDKIRVPDVLNQLRKRNIDNRIIQLVKDINKNNSTFISINNEKSTKIPIATGIRQGDSLSPSLFNIIMDEIISTVKSAPVNGYKMGANEIKIVCYADDAVILADTEDNAQRLLYIFEQSAAKFKMQISDTKTKAMTVSKQPLRCKLAVYERSIEQVMSFQYLGSTITSHRDLVEEVKAQATKAARISGYLRDIVWRNKNMSVRSKTRIYKTCVRPIMTYTVETRADTTTTQRILTTTEMQTLRAVCGRTRLDHIRNEEIRSLCEVQDICKWSRRRRKEWQKHVKRMGPDRIARIAMENKPIANRPPGRPPKRWNECWTSESQND